MKIWLPVIRGGSGTDVFTRRLASALEKRGIRTQVSWFPACFEFAPYLLRYVTPPSGTTIVHANSWNAFSFYRHGIPLVATEHLGTLDQAPGFRSSLQKMYHSTFIRRFVERSMTRAAAVTAVSRYAADTIDQAGMRRDVKVIYNWIDTHRFRPPTAASAIRKPESRQTRLLFMGNPSVRKGADLLAPIMRELGPSFTLTYTAGLQSRALSNVAANMRNVGRIDDEDEIIRLYQDTDILLFPTRQEGFGLAALEAMACGVPVIATRGTALPEVVEDGVTGMLCPEGDVPAFVTACRLLGADRHLWQTTSAGARRRAEMLFSEDIIIPQYIGLYEALLSGTP